MKKLMIVLFFGMIYAFGNNLYAQILKPVITFKEDPQTHNVHITTDGEYYYTVNGGRANKGQINKFSYNGKLLDTYEMLLDMRSIMYNNKDKKFYVCTYERDIYRITNMQTGRYEKVLSGIYENEQANIAMSNDGKSIYYMSDGDLIIYKFPSGKKSKKLTGFDCGRDFISGSCAVATDGKYFYTWNADYKMIYAYNMKGQKVKSFEIDKGSYGFSLSCANGLVFVSDDGNYDVGTWYGYKLWSE